MGHVLYVAEYCNRTIGHEEVNSDRRMTLRMRDVRLEDKGKPLYCWFRFHTSPPHIIQVDVRDVRAGDYDLVGKR